MSDQRNRPAAYGWSVWMRFDDADALLAALSVVNLLLSIAVLILGHDAWSAVAGWLMAVFLWWRVWRMAREARDAG